MGHARQARRIAKHKTGEIDGIPPKYDLKSINRDTRCRLQYTVPQSSVVHTGHMALAHAVSVGISWPMDQDEATFLKRAFAAIMPTARLLRFQLFRQKSGEKFQKPPNALELRRIEAAARAKQPPQAIPAMSETERAAIVSKIMGASDGAA